MPRPNRSGRGILGGAAKASAAHGGRDAAVVFAVHGAVGVAYLQAVALSVDFAVFYHSFHSVCGHKLAETRNT